MFAELIIVGRKGYNEDFGKDFQLRAAAPQAAPSRRAALAAVALQSG